MMARITDQRRIWHTDRDALMIGDFSAHSVAERFGTPMYLYDGNIVCARFAEIQSAFPDFEILYSLKANPNRWVAQLLAQCGAGAEVASMHELNVALKAGFSTSKITFGGPGKTPDEIDTCLELGVGTIDIESERELALLKERSRRAKVAVEFTVRINTRSRPLFAGEFMAGEGSRFGIDEEEIERILLPYLSCSTMTCVGIHAHVASQVLDASELLRHYENLFFLSQRLYNSLGLDIKVINFGGGMGIPYSAKEERLNVAQLGRDASRILPSASYSMRTRPIYQLELGRFLVAEAGIFLTKVVEVKESRGQKFIITDSGISGFARSAMNWAQQHRCSIVNKEEEEPVCEYVVVGRSCMPSDILCEKACLPAVEPGDVLAIHNAGAYGYSMSLLVWGSHIAPLEVLYLNDFEVIRERLNF